MFDQMNYEDFYKIVGTDFNFDYSGQNIKLKLFEISEKHETSQTIFFSIYLKSPKEIFLEQKTYSLKHDKLGVGEIFIVPIREDEDGIVYESVFNRYIES